jgi:hypothetical protein
MGRMVENTAPPRPPLPARPAYPAHPAIVFLCVVCAAVIVVAQPAREPTLPDLLQRAGAYVQQLEADFSTVIGDEQYEQKAVLRTQHGADGRASRTRKLTSEMSFMFLPDDAAWLSIRNVLRVDKDPVADSKARLDAALADPTPARGWQLRRLRDEGARFNIGRMSRNFADPMLGIQLADPWFQPRFTFAYGGVERVRGLPTVRVTFVERTHPAIIRRGADDADLLSRGDLWISSTDGAVHQTRLVIDDSKFDARATITVVFAREVKLDRWLPARMDEEYVQQGVSGPTGAFIERIECVATYSNYRRFETSARVLPQ